MVTGEKTHLGLLQGWVCLGEGGVTSGPSRGLFMEGSQERGSGVLQVGSVWFWGSQSPRHPCLQPCWGGLSSGSQGPCAGPCSEHRGAIIESALLLCVYLSSFALVGLRRNRKMLSVAGHAQRSLGKCLRVHCQLVSAFLWDLLRVCTRDNGYIS